jgi:hypothetical protein
VAEQAARTQGCDRGSADPANTAGFRPRKNVRSTFSTASQRLIREESDMDRRREKRLNWIAELVRFHLVLAFLRRRRW